MSEVFNRHQCLWRRNSVHNSGRWLRYDVISFSYSEYFYYVPAAAWRAKEGGQGTCDSGSRGGGFLVLGSHAHDITRAIMISGCID